MTTDAAPDAKRAPAARRAGAADRIDFVVGLVYVQWAMLLFEPTWFISQFGGGSFFKRLPTLLDLPLFAIWVLMGRGRGMYWPLLVFVGLVVMWLPFLDNRGVGTSVWRVVYNAVLLVTASAAFLRTPKRVQPVVLMYGLAFFWYGIQGLPGGLVRWHFSLSNEDAFGPLMVMGTGFCFYMSAGARSKKWRLFFFGTFVLAILGVIASFARGAVLALGLVLVVLWWRSSRKFVLLVAAIPAAVLLTLAIPLIHPEGGFFEEMSTVTEGVDTGTSGDRWVLWNAAVDIWKTRPFFGTGPQHWGIVAARTFDYDPERKFYANPLKLYGRSMHNTILEILVEWGLIGFGTFLFAMWDFRRRLNLLKKPGRRRIWDRSTGGGFDLGQIATALELAMIGWVANCMFYGLFYFHWFWTLIGLSWILTSVTDGPPPPRRPRSGGPPTAKRGRAAAPEAKPNPAGASLGGGLIGASGGKPR